MSAATNDSPHERLSDAIGKLWWVPLARGILLVVLGCYALFRPGMSALALTQVVSDRPTDKLEAPCNDVENWWEMTYIPPEPQ